MVRLKKVIRVSLIALNLISITAAFILIPYFLHNRPVDPQPELHRTWPLNEHGRIVYLTQSEKLLIDFLFFTFLTTLLVLGGLAFKGALPVYLKRRRQREEDRKGERDRQKRGRKRE